MKYIKWLFYFWFYLFFVLIVLLLLGFQYVLEAVLPWLEEKLDEIGDRFMGVKL